MAFGELLEISRNNKSKEMKKTIKNDFPNIHTVQLFKRPPHQPAGRDDKLRTHKPG